MQRNRLFPLALSLCVLLVLSLSLAGCGGLRFAPSQSQKQLAFATHQAARSAADLGLQPGSEAAKQIVVGTAASLAYSGMPQTPEIADYDTTAAQAASDAARRPAAQDVFNAAEGGLSLASQLILALGFGGAGIGGKKLIDWIALARQKSDAFKEVVQGNELLAQYLRDQGKTAELNTFKAAQTSVQSPQTELLVTAERIPIKRQIVIAQPTPIVPV